MPKHIDEPLMTIWFGNFYKPAYDDRAFIDESMRRIREMGFNCVELDSKAWEDFSVRFQGGEASEYVAQQEYMMEAAAKNDLGYMFLALYLNGDNLYPNIRFSPPIHGESITNLDGSDGRWYKYWSEKARQVQQDHVQGLLKLYQAGMAEIAVDGETRLPICSMWDAFTAPSFDAEGQNRYRNWLEKQYGDIASFNAAYQSAFTSFADLRPEDYWFAATHERRACYTRQDLMENTPAFVMWADNISWQADELTQYFAAMKERLHALVPALFLMPNLSQWNHYLNVATFRKSDIGFSWAWDTATRGIDMRALSPHLDMAHYYALPVTADSDPEPYAVSCQHAHIRSLNPGRPFLGGVYYGRFLLNDIFRFITPEEVVGSIVASGASGISAYGFCGMDDGGLLHRMEEGFMDSLARGNDWAKAVIPRLGQRKKSRVAILYPTAMALLEPLGVEGADEKRADLLGVYKACRDYGYDPEIVEIPDLLARLDADVLLIPADECYHAMRNQKAEEALRQFADQGGIIVHGPDADIIRLAFDLHPEATSGTCFTYQNEGGLLSGHGLVSWPGEAIAVWREDEKPCISRQEYGRGIIYSFGFPMGYQYASRTAPHVPFSQKNNELYPVALMNHQPLRDILLDAAEKDALFAMKDVESSPFVHGWVVVNHRSTPVSIPLEGIWHRTQESSPGILPGHSAVFIESGEKR